MYSFDNTKQQTSRWKKSKKAILCALAGTFLLTGLAVSQVPETIALAATRDFGGYHHRDSHWGYESNNWNYADRRDVSPETIAQNLADCFDLDKQSILNYNQQGWKLYDLREAAFLSFASQKPFADVLNMKTASNDWYDVSESLGLTREQFYAAREKLMVKRLSANLQIDASEIQDLLQKGYHPRDIAIANQLAAKADKKTSQVLSMKKINNRWSDVAKDLGISVDDYRAALDDMRSCPGFDGPGRHDNYRGQHFRDSRY